MRRATYFLTALALALGTTAAITVPAQALQAPVAFTSASLSTWQTDGVAWQIAQADGLVFVGGSFTGLRPPGAADDVDEISRTNFAVLDAATGAPTACAPTFTLNDVAEGASVRSLSVSPDRSTLYIGGYFSKVNGVGNAHMIALNIATCSVVTSFKPLPGGMVHTIVSTPAAVYFGGAFTSVAGQPRTRAAAVDAVGTATPGALLPWAPSFDIEVLALATSPDLTKVAAGGRFNFVNGANSHSLAVVDATTGANVRTYPVGFISQNSVTKAITTDATGFYIANEGTGGGVFDGRAAFDWSTLDQRWRDTCLGATQTILVYQEVLYSGSHAHDCSSMGSFPDGARYHLLAQGVNDPTLLPWFPNTNEGIGEQIGPRSITVATTPGMDYLWTAGEFTKVNGVNQQGLTRFGQGPDTAAPSSPTSSLNPFRPGQVQVSWRTSLDTDDADLTYSVFRDNSTTPLYTTTATSWFWDRPQLTYVDTGLALGSTHTYRISASDGTNTVFTPWRSVTVASVFSTYAERIAADGANQLWRYDEASDTFLSDYMGNNNGTLLGAATYQVSPGAVAGDPSRAMTLPGSSTIYTSTLAPSPSTFSAETWFKTTTTNGGKILGFGNRQTTQSGNYDKHVYMTNSGQLTFGVYTGATVTVKSPSSYNDGSWHHVVATQNSTGMVLYVDGAKVGRNGTTTNQAFDGYWRVGGDNLNGWPDRPSSDNFEGTVDETAIYPSALSAATVADHFVLAGGTLAPGVSGPADFYGRSVFDDSPDLYWRLGESSGSTAADASGSNLTGQYSSNVTYGRPGAVAGTTDTAVRFNGTSNGRAASNSSSGHPSVFTAEAWFKTTTNSGGKIFGFGSSKTGTSGSYDKHLYMTNAGTLVFGVWSGSASVLTTAATYNNDLYHHVVASQGPSGLQLWVDGVLVGSNSTSTSSAYSGYWRLGGDSISGWPSQPSSSNFSGTIDEFAVYHDVLSPAQVAAHYSAGNLSAPDAAAPTKPTGLTGAVAVGATELTWAPSLDNVAVTGYDVYRSQTLGFVADGSSYVGTTAGTTYTDNAVTPGSWYYRVIAKDAAANRSAASSQISVIVTDTAAPSVPAGLTAPATSTSAALSWTASTDNVGVVGYDVHRSATAGFVPGPSNLVSTVTDPSFVDTPLALGTWHYRVVARDAAGNVSDASAEATATVSDTAAPTVPSDVVTTPSAGAVGVSWSASIDDVGVTSYRVYRSATSGFVAGPANLVGTVAGTNFVDTPVAIGTWYYRVDARDGTGNASAASLQATAVVVPTTTTATLAPIADAYANQGAAATNFGSSSSLVAASSAAAVAYLRFNLPAAPSGTELTGAVLKVRTNSDVNAGAVGSPSVRVGSDTWVESTLNWNNRPAATGAVLGSIAAASSPNTVYNTVLNPGGLQPLVGGTATVAVTNTTTDSFWFWSSNHANVSYRPQLVLTYTPLDVAPPTVPANVLADVSGYSVALTWQQSLDNVGVTGYDVHRSSSDGFTPGPSTLIGSSATTAYSDNGVAPGTYFYRVIAKDAKANASAASVEISAVVADGTPPSVPTGLLAGASSTSAALTWTPSTDNVEVTEYNVYRSQTAGFVPGPSNLIAAVTEPSYLDSPLVFGSWYYRVTAKDAVGNTSAATAEVTAVIADVTAPTAPEDLTAVGSGSSVDLAWSASSDDVAVAAYDVHRSSTAGFVPGPSTLLDTVNQTTFIDSPVAAGSWYYRLVAKDTSGNSSIASLEASASVVDTEGPSAPTDVVTDVSGATVDVTWTASTDNVAVTGYDVYRSASPGFTPGPSTLIGTAPGTSYSDTATVGTWYYQVIATDGSGNVSTASAEAEAVVTDAAPPSTPSGVTAQMNGVDVDVAWTASTDDVAVTGYDVYRSASAGFTPGPSTLIATTASTSVTDPSPATGTWYYKVVAKDAEGNRSDASAEADVVVPDTTAPSLPASASAVAAGATVTFTWAASTDNVGVTGYDVYRSATAGFTPGPGTLLGTTALLSYTDSFVPAGTWHYRVIAKDAVGNRSAASAEAPVTVASAPTVVNVSPLADSYVNAGAANTNFGTSSSLAALSTPGGFTLLRFVLPAAPPGKTLTGASLRVRTTSDVNAGAVGNLTVRVGADTWVESTVTWNNRPTVTGAVLGSVQANTVPNTTYNTVLDPAGLQSLVGSQGTIAITNTVTDGFWVWSSNYGNVSLRPQLTLTYS